ncbi:MAG: hypothetical protein EZS28_023120 [Streblomastix strix]|uniref:Uncharacterized protein n=1 Tax=Streblomastix strix TaxID=222440 RepID=A0A5J4VFX6_9EUKA|nr:MAG: hypothetical protein EZS28_023120 [Streblomastix strix]
MTTKEYYVIGRLTRLEDHLSEGPRAVLLVKRLPQGAAVVNPDRTEEDQSEVKTLIVDIRTLKTENLTAESQRFKKFALIYSNQRIDNNNSFYAWAAIYINGINQLKAELCMMTEHYSPTHVTKSKKKVIKHFVHVAVSFYFLFDKNPF